MTTAEFQIVRSAFISVVDIANQLGQYGTSIDACQKQLLDTVGPAAAWLLPFTSTIMSPEKDALQQVISMGKGLYHECYNPGNTPNFHFPPPYNVFHNLTCIIQESCTAQKAAAGVATSNPPAVGTKTKPPPMVILLQKTCTSFRKTTSTHVVEVDNSEEEEAPPKPPTEQGDSMNVDKDGPKPIPANLKFKKSGKENACATAQSSFPS
ncbi:hypothetical protein B0H10DRAFT_1939861 [Mycena sp. CBHHK59/15]|nr:hypothetical protein B0H10DRAFT_1939861 [Mycena sp. CBHHK59/15]